MSQSSVRSSNSEAMAFRFRNAFREAFREAFRDFVSIFQSAYSA